MLRPHLLPAVLLALAVCACGDPRDDMVGGYPVTGTLKVDGSTSSERMRDYLDVSSETSSSDKLSVLLSGFQCVPGAKMTGPLEFSLERTECPPETSDGCTHTMVLERGTGGKFEKESELVIDYRGTISTRCTDGRTGKLGFSVKMSGFRATEESAVREDPSREGTPLEQRVRSMLR